MFLFTKPSEETICDFLTRQGTSRFSYAPVGSSERSEGAHGYVTDHNRILLGHGEEAWKRARKAIDTWQPFHFDWVQLCWPDAAIAQGTNVGVLIKHFGFWSLNAARIAYVFDESSNAMKRYGFAYGTLLEHAEAGEERFSVEWHNQDNSVWYDLFAFSQPRALIARLGNPLVRWQQARFRKASKAAMVMAVGNDPAST